MPHRVRHPGERGGVQRQPPAAAICSVATPCSIARAPAAIACVPAAPGSALDSRSRTRATFSLPRPASSPMLNVLVNSASSCATSRTTAPPPGAPPRLMHSNATCRGRANILKRPDRINVRSGSVAGPPPSQRAEGNLHPGRVCFWVYLQDPLTLRIG